MTMPLSGKGLSECYEKYAHIVNNAVRYSFSPVRKSGSPRRRMEKHAPERCGVEVLAYLRSDGTLHA